MENSVSPEQLLQTVVGEAVEKLQASGVVVQGDMTIGDLFRLVNDGTAEEREIALDVVARLRTAFLDKDGTPKIENMIFLGPIAAQFLQIASNSTDNIIRALGVAQKFLQPQQNVMFNKIDVNPGANGYFGANNRGGGRMIMSPNMSNDMDREKAVEKSLFKDSVREEKKNEVIIDVKNIVVEEENKEEDSTTPIV